jgi:hypothetical protein
MGSVSAQTGVAPLRSSSDAGQRVFDQRVQRASAPIDTTVHELAAVDVAPVYPGGDGALFGHLAQAPGCVLEGWNADGMARTKVMLRFVVEANGSVSQWTLRCAAMQVVPQGPCSGSRRVPRTAAQCVRCYDCPCNTSRVDLVGP